MADMGTISRDLAGRYKLERVLGRGGMALVYAARDRRLDRPVAIKVVPVAVTAPAERDRFTREAQSAAGLRHHNAVAVFDAGEADGLLYIVMELVEGRSLAEELAERGPFEPAEAAAIAASLLDALGHAHDLGIIHRDVKPSNVMVSYDGTVKLLDFGIARRLGDITDSVTGAGQVFGTPKYLAPEQIEGRPATQATDLYAVGVVLFEMLTGVAPFNGDTPIATAIAHARAPVPDVRSLQPDVPIALGAAIRTAMAKDPERRFPDARAMRDALLDGMAGVTADLEPWADAPEPTQMLAVDAHVRRTRPWWLAGAAGLALAGLVIWNLGTGVIEFITSGEPPAERSALASPTSTPVVTTATTLPATSTTVPTTIAGIIAVLQADPQAYGLHTAEIIDALADIDQGDAPAERAAGLLDDVRAWIAAGEATPAALALLEPVLSPLLAIAPDAGNDSDRRGGGSGGSGNGGGGNGGANGGGNGNGKGNGRGNGKNK